MFFCKKKKSATKETRFETAFQKRIGRTPVAYIAEKIASGTDVQSAKYLFDIISAEISRDSSSRNPGFDYFYKQVTVYQNVEAQSTKPQPTKVSRGFATTQLIGKDRFLTQYKQQLKALSENREFMQFIAELRHQLSGQEISNTKVANMQIADYFYKNHANERFPEVKEIVEAVLHYGKQASAHISIYYAMYLYQ